MLRGKRASLRRFGVGLATTFAILLSPSLVGQAVAAPPSEAESSTDTFTFSTGFTEVPYSSSGGVTLAAAGCKAAVGSIYLKNIFGNELWGYFQRMDWCWGSGGKITSKSRTRWAEVYAPAWEFVKHIGSTQSGGVDYTYWRAWTQGHFKVLRGLRPAQVSLDRHDC